MKQTLTITVTKDYEHVDPLTQADTDELIALLKQHVFPEGSEVTLKLETE